MAGWILFRLIDNYYVQLSGDEMKTLTIALIAVIVSGCGSTDDKHRWMLNKIEEDRIEAMKKAELAEYEATGRVERVERERAQQKAMENVYLTPEEISALGPRSSGSDFIMVMPMRSGNPYID